MTEHKPSFVSCTNLFFTKALLCNGTFNTGPNNFNCFQKPNFKKVIQEDIQSNITLSFFTICTFFKKLLI